MNDRNERREVLDKASWRPRDTGASRIDIDRHLDSTTRMALDAGEGWRDRYELSTGDGYNPIGAEYLRNVGITGSEEVARPVQNGWNGAAWRDATHRIETEETRNSDLSFGDAEPSTRD